MHSYARIYWCMGKLLILDMDACLDLMLTKRGRSWLKRWKKEAACERLTWTDKIQYFLEVKKEEQQNREQQYKENNKNSESL